MCRKRIYFAGLLCFYSHMSWAWSGSEPLPVWEVHIGAVSLQTPDYRGSSSEKTRVFPFPAIIYRGEHVRIDDGQAQGLIYTSKAIEFGISLAASFPASSKENSARQGMPRLDATFEIGPSVTSQVWQSADENTSLALELPMRAAFSVNDNLTIANRGWVFSPSIRLKHEEDSWAWELTAGPIFATGDYHRYFYEVQSEFATLARPTYQANGGYSGSKFTMDIKKRFNQLSLIGFMRYDALAGSAFSDSPLVEQNNSFSFGFAVLWKISESSRLTNRP